MSRGRALALAIAIGAVALVSGPAWARGLPDWAEQVAETAPPPPEGISKIRGRVLLSEEWTRVEPDGSVRTRRRLAHQALSAYSGDVGVGFFGLPDTAKMTVNKVWHVPPGKMGRREMALPITATSESTFLGGARARVMQIDGIQKGSLVFFEFESVDKPYFMMLGRRFYEGGLPVDVARYVLELPDGWTMQQEWLGGDDLVPTREGNASVWELRNLKMQEEEPLAPDGWDEAPMLAVGVTAPAGAKTVAPTFSDWNAFGHWYTSLIRGREEPNEAIRQAATSLGEAGLGFADTVNRAGMMVRDRVRYVAVELGIGGWQPRAAGDTLGNLYGDCKDKGTLLRSILSQRGITSYPVLVNLTSRETVPSRVPYPGFDHFIVAVSVPPGTDIPDTLKSAIVDGGEIGTLLIVDTTDDSLSIGSMSSGLSGKRALVVTGERAQVITLPGTREGDHVVRRSLTAELKPDRSVTLRRVSSYAGGFASSARADYRDSATERRKLIEERVASIWPDATVQEYDVRPETAEGTFEETVAIARRPIPPAGAGARVPMFPGVEGEVPRVPTTKRTTPVDYVFPRRIVYEVTYRGLPPEAVLPKPQDTTGEGWSVKSSAERRGEEIVAALTIDISRTRFDVEAFPELRKLWSAVTTAAGRAISLETAPPR